MLAKVAAKVQIILDMGKFFGKKRIRNVIFTGKSGES